MDDGKSRLAELFSREKSRLLRFVRRQLLELADMDAEDIVSEVAYSLLRRADVISKVENLNAYVYRSLANRVLDHRRQAPNIAPTPISGEGEEPLFDPPDTRQTRPDQQLQQAELRERLHHAIGQLSSEERAVWVATEIDGLTFRELAEEWDEPIGTLLSRKSRANEKLRQMLADYKDSR